MLALEWLAERKIEEAVSRGEFSGLPGEGRPLPPEEDDALVPEEERMANRILKNAGIDPALTRRRLALLTAGFETRYFRKAAAR